jgi:hypothetical protein
MRKGLFLCLAGVVVVAPKAGDAAVLYSENFDVDHTANWVYNASNAGNVGDFFFDYSSVGIPPAPGSSTTRGFKMEANIPGTAVFSGGSGSPVGLALPAQYTVSAYVWQNSIGPFPAGGSGSTQTTTMTIGASGSAAEFAGSTITGVQASITGEGNSSSDWRLYSGSFPDGAGATISPSLHPGTYIAGTDSSGGTQDARQASNTFYVTNFPGTVPPAAQTLLFPTQTGTTMNGTPALAWHHWQMIKTDTNIYFNIDGKLINTLPASLWPALGNNFAFGQSDINATSSTAATARSLLFGLVDNITVTDQVPEPAMLGTLGMLGAGLLLRRRR